MSVLTLKYISRLYLEILAEDEGDKQRPPHSRKVENMKNTAFWVFELCGQWNVFTKYGGDVKIAVLVKVVAMVKLMAVLLVGN